MLLVPDYMRTKLELDLEAKQRDLHAVAASPPQGFEVHYIYIELLTKTLELKLLSYTLFTLHIQTMLAQFIKCLYSFSYKCKHYQKCVLRLL